MNNKIILSLMLLVMIFFVNSLTPIPIINVPRNTTTLTGVVYYTSGGLSFNISNIAITCSLGYYSYFNGTGFECEEDITGAVSISERMLNDTTYAAISERLLNSTLSNYMLNSTVYDETNTRVLNTTLSGYMQNDTTYEAISLRVLNGTIPTHNQSLNTTDNVQFAQVYSYWYDEENDVIYDSKYDNGGFFAYTYNGSDYPNIYASVQVNMNDWNEPNIMMNYNMGSDNVLTVNPNQFSYLGGNVCTDTNGLCGGGNPFDQSLNTTNGVRFENISLSESMGDIFMSGLGINLSDEMTNGYFFISNADGTPRFQMVDGGTGEIYLNIDRNSFTYFGDSICTNTNVSLRVLNDTLSNYMLNTTVYAETNKRVLNTTLSDYMQNTTTYIAISAKVSNGTKVCYDTSCNTYTCTNSTGSLIISNRVIGYGC